MLCVEESLLPFLICQTFVAQPHRRELRERGGDLHSTCMVWLRERLLVRRSSPLPHLPSPFIIYSDRGGTPLNLLFVYLFSLGTHLTLPSPVRPFPFREEADRDRRNRERPPPHYSLPLDLGGGGRGKAGGGRGRQGQGLRPCLCFQT